MRRFCIALCALFGCGGSTGIFEGHALIAAVHADPRPFIEVSGHPIAYDETVVVLATHSEWRGSVAQLARLCSAPSRPIDCVLLGATWVEVASNEVPSTHRDGASAPSPSIVERHCVVRDDRCYVDRPRGNFRVQATAMREALEHSSDTGSFSLVVRDVQGKARVIERHDLFDAPTAKLQAGTIETLLSGCAGKVTPWTCQLEGNPRVRVFLQSSPMHSGAIWGEVLGVVYLSALLSAGIGAGVCVREHCPQGTTVALGTTAGVLGAGVIVGLAYALSKWRIAAR